MKGTAAERPLPEVVRDLHFDAADGILKCASGGRASEIYFDRGTAFYCKVDSPDQRLDRILVKWGLIREDAVQGLIQRAGPDVRGALVREGVFPNEAAFDEFMAQVLRERMLEVLASEADWEFQPQDVRALRRQPFPVGTPDLVLESVRRLARRDVIDTLSADEAHLQPNPQPAVPLSTLHLSPVEGYVLSQVNGTTGIGEIASVSPMPREQTLALLYGLLVLDVIRHPVFAGYRFSVFELARRAAESRTRYERERAAIEAEYERVRQGDLMQLVPEAAGRSGPERREAIKAYQERWSPDRFCDKVAREKREELLLVAGRAGEALLAEMESARRVQASEATEAREQGEDAFRLKRMEFSKSEAQEKIEAQSSVAQDYYRRAQDSFRAKDYHSAIQYLREALRRHEAAEYHALLGDALAQNPHWTRKAEEAYLRAAELDQFDARVRVALGRIYQKAGLKERARDQYERALAIQKDHEEAREGLRQLRK